MRVAATVLAVVCFGAMSLSAERDARVNATADNSAASIILTVAPQDSGLFATWSEIAPAPEYVLRWKAAGDERWREVRPTQRGAFVADLQNGVLHELQVEARRANTLVAASAIVTGTPRPRGDCVALDYYPWLPPVSFFCSKAALDAYVQQQALEFRSLRCRQQAVTRWDAQTPNCLYSTSTGEQLLLLRQADSVFAGAGQYPRPADIRRAARRAIWGGQDPFVAGFTSTRTVLPQVATGRVTRYARALSFLVEYPGGLPSRITWFVPHAPAGGRYSIYHEGHGGAAVDIGAETIEWLLDRGWHVVAMDMPLVGANAVDARPGLQAHGEFDALDDGVTSPLRLFLSPVQSVVDWIAEGHGAGDPDLLLIGRSGGGWTSYVYGALDPRIDVVASVAGGRAISERLDAPWGAAELGDYEQTVPHLYDSVPHEHLMLAAGARGAFYLYNQWDACCFRLQPDNPFVAYLRAGGAAIQKPISVVVDSQNPGHSMGPAGYAALEHHLAYVFLGSTRVPGAPGGMRVVR